MADLEAQNFANNKDPHNIATLARGGIGHGPFDLTVDDLTYKDSKLVSFKTKKGVEEKILLNAVNARARHGHILAVVGPSGPGKSTFPDAVAGRINRSSLDGSILVNGKPIEPSFTRQSGYVMQDDALFPMLSVRETLMFSARLRLPGSMGMVEKRARVEELIMALGLSACADTKIGNEEVRGVSGGERRRVSIVVDLIHDPPVLFLDEPTSGLDSTSALNVMQNLNTIAEERQRTIVLTIHQPSFRILDLIHNYLVLANGNAIYHGPYPGLIGYFREYGKEVPEHVNTLEYALDLIEEEQNSPQGLTPLIEYRKRTEELSVELVIPASFSAMGQLAGAEYATGFLNEVLVLADRNVKNIFRTPELFLSRIGLNVVAALMLGSLFFNSGLNPSGVGKRQSFFAFSLALILFTSTEALPIFLAERQVFIRETTRGAYRTAAYVLSSALVFMPFLFLLAMVYGGISYFMVGLYPSVDAFFFFVFVCFLTLCLGNSYVTFCGGIVPNFIIGNTIVTASIAFFFLFCGFFIPRHDIPKYWIWLHYLSTFKYPLELMEDNEYRRRPDVCWTNGLHDLTGCNMTPSDVLNEFSVGGVHRWANILIMILFIVGYRVFFWIALKAQTAKLRK